MQKEELNSSIMIALIKMIYEPKIHEGSPKRGDYGGFDVKRRFVVKMPSDIDPQDQGYELFTTTVNNEPYLGLYRTWYGEYGEDGGTIDALIRLNNLDDERGACFRLSELRRLTAWVLAIAQYWEEAG